MIQKDKTILEARQKLNKILCNRFQSVIDTAAIQWKEQHKKRSISFVSGMGTAFYTIDDHIVEIDFCSNHYAISGTNIDSYMIGTKAETILKHLIDAFKFLSDNLENHEFLSDYLEDKGY